MFSFPCWQNVPDLLLIGVGERMTERLDPALVDHIRSKGIRVEQLDTVRDEEISRNPLKKDFIPQINSNTWRIRHEN